MHNILQGVANPDQRLSEEEKATIRDWIQDNAKRYWLAEGGPLRPVAEGGADIIVVSFFSRYSVRQDQNCLKQ